MKQHKSTGVQAASGFFETNRELSSCIFLSKLYKISLIQNSDPPDKESWAKTRPPPGSENVRIPGGRWGGDDQAWN